MPVLPQDILLLAQDLVLGPGESSRRSAVSRAYYACYHQARQASRCDTKGPDSHRRVWVELELLARTKHPGWDYRKAAQMGQELKADRQLSDYDLHETLTSEQAKVTVSKATRLMKLLGKLFPR